MKYSIGVDLGGTKINTVLIDKKGKILRKIKLPTGKNHKKIILNLVDSINYVKQGINKKHILGIGMGVPGIIDRKKGKILNLPNLKWKNIDLKKIIGNKFKLKFKLENDADCMALGIKKYIFPKVDNLILMTIGTGLGGGIIIHNKLYYGQGNAGEFGHTIINKNNSKEKELEEFVSKRAIIKLTKKFKLKEKNPKKIEDLGRAGNKKAKKVYAELAKNLAVGVTNVINSFNPGIIVFSGGIARADELILKPLIKELNKIKLMKKLPKIKIVRNQDYGAIGAASLLYN